MCLGPHGSRELPPEQTTSRDMDNDDDNVPVTSREQLEDNATLLGDQDLPTNTMANEESYGIDDNLLSSSL